MDLAATAANPHVAKGRRGISDTDLNSSCKVANAMTKANAPMIPIIELAVLRTFCSVRSGINDTAQLL